LLDDGVLDADRVAEGEREMDTVDVCAAVRVLDGLAPELEEAVCIVTRLNIHE
jgi:hypothetical protein